MFLGSNHKKIFICGVQSPQHKDGENEVAAETLSVQPPSPAYALLGNGYFCLEATYSRQTYHYAQGWKVHSQTSGRVQVMSTVVTDGKLVSMTLSDGVYVSANIIPEDESLGQQLISLEKFDLLKIHEASVYKSHLIIQNVEQLQMTREGRVVDIKKTVKADGVSGLRIMKKEALDLWGIRFSNMQKIEWRPAAAADDLSQTIMADDGVLERVGKKEEQPKEPSPPRVRSKRKMESCPFCVRSFTDKENLKEHMRSDHFDS